MRSVATWIAKSLIYQVYQVAVDLEAIRAERQKSSVLDVKSIDYRAERHDSCLGSSDGGFFKVSDSRFNALVEALFDTTSFRCSCQCHTVK
jgi:hypothetical protein